MVSPLNIKKSVLFRLRDIKNVNNIYILKDTNLTIVEQVKDLSVYIFQKIKILHIFVITFILTFLITCH